MRNISLTRATPPYIEHVAQIITQTSTEITKAPAFGRDLHLHRFSGTEEDKRAGSFWLSKRLGRAPNLERIAVTNGTQNSILMLISALVGRGGTLATECLSYPQIGALCSLLGARVVAVDQDENGIVPTSFENVCRTERPSALYVIPTIQNPTCTTMPLDRRREIAAIARTHGVVIFEDDAQGMLPAEGPVPLAAVAPDITWYVATLSKCISVGLRVGFLVAPTRGDLDQVMSRFARMSMWFPTPFSASLATTLIRTGRADDIVACIRREMDRRHALASEVLADVSHIRASNSLFLWLRLASADQFRTVDSFTRQVGISIRGYHEFIVPGAKSFSPGARVSLTSASIGELEDALLRLSRLADATE
ncbi:PLP-dependent aminotransferase family protein [Sinorhizobium meliloti]|uniref:Aminotransferase class I/II-fold pyridoxal phosphate-dependent enzyme n=1 Tax=Rhizobium meliloti TaxID=382 RepID=A0AAW9TK70_RHIML|nr:PLP-dependent aminotransferase family protein [Sinorhizobium meliloti]MQW32107.1 aminotransferase class I/II-fold pyridoxal phosphate-dependent enzyme [Sinorhizobium meliloti]